MSNRLVPRRFECRREIVQFGQLCLQRVGTRLLDGKFLTSLRGRGLRALKLLAMQPFGHCSFFSEAHQLLLSLLGLLARPIHCPARAATAWGTLAVTTRIWSFCAKRVALSPAAVGEIVQRRARLAGLEGNFGGHSLRSGFVTEASRQGVALPAIMQLTEHRSVSSVMGYFQTGGAATNPAARLLEG